MNPTCFTCGDVLLSSAPCSCTGNEDQINSLCHCRWRSAFCDWCRCIPAPNPYWSRIADSSDFDEVRSYPSGPDGWGCSSRQRTLWCRNKRMMWSARKQGRKYGRRTSLSFRSA